MMLFFKDKREGMFLTLFFSSFFFSSEDFLWCFVFIFGCFFRVFFFFPCRDGICKCILQQCLQRVCSLAMLVEATEQDVNFIVFLLLFLLFFFFFDTQCNLQGFFSSSFSVFDACL